MNQIVDNSAGFKINGRGLTRRLKRLSPKSRVSLADQMVAGKVVLRRMTRLQASLLAQVPVASLATPQRKNPPAKLDQIITRHGADRILAALDRLTAPPNGNGAGV